MGQVYAEQAQGARPEYPAHMGAVACTYNPSDREVEMEESRWLTSVSQSNPKAILQVL